MAETKPWPRAQRMPTVMAGERAQPHHYQAIAEYDEARGETTPRYSSHGGHSEFTAAQVNQAIEWWNKRAALEERLDGAEPQPYPGFSIDITWPATTSNGTPLVTWPMQVHDHQTGKPLLGITGLRINLGGEQWNTEVIQADITTLVGADGQPLLGENVKPIWDPDDLERVYSRVFRCYVTEMRIRDGKS